MSHATSEDRRARARERKRRSREKNRARDAAKRAAQRAQHHPCACGCGEQISGTATFKAGHQNRPCRSPVEFERYMKSRRVREREYQRQWRAEHPERLAKHMAAYKKSPAYEQAKDRARKRYQENPDAAWEASLRRKFGLTANDYFTMLAAQDHGCAVCGEHDPGGRPRAGGAIRMAVDHCHTTGVIRGLLCRRCNVIIGKAADDPELLRKAMEYVRHHLTS